MTRPDFSIAQRLSLGFGLFLLLLVSMLGVVFTLQARSDAAQDNFVHRIEPSREVAQDVERALLLLGLNARGYLLTGTPETLERYRAGLALLRRRVESMETQATEPDDRAHVRAITPLLDAYVQTVDRAVEDARRGVRDDDTESRLSAARDATVAEVRRFADVQEARQAAALATMRETRQNVGQGLLFVSVVSALGFVGLAWTIARTVQRPTRDLLQIAEAMHDGNLKPALEWSPAGTHGRALSARKPRSELTRLALSFGSAAASLERRHRRLRADAMVTAAIGHSLKKADVADASLRVIAEHLDAAVGVVYAYDAEERLLRPIASLALGTTPVPVLRFDEGLPGAAASQGRVVLVHDVPGDTPFAVNLGFGTLPPRSIVAAPIVFQHDLLGVIVLASVREFDADALEFIDVVAAQLGVGLQNVRAHEDAERLAAELQDQNHVVQAQNEEIQAQNEEIQAQTEELQAQNEELQAQNDQIRQRAEDVERASQLLAEADERKNDFLATLGHELRNPMAALTVSLQVFNQSAPGSDRARRAQAVIERQVQHLIRLIDDLLDITRISRGKIFIEPEPVDLTDAVRSCVEDQRAEAESKGLSLQLDLPAVGLWIDGDQTRVCQIVNNLLHNACKFASRGGHIVVTLAQAAEGNEATLEVRDDGAGIDPSLLPHVFEPFRQGAMSLARTNTGLGLGLALVKTLAELHGGSVHAHSDGSGYGSTFTVRFPLGRAAAATTATQDGGPSRARRVLIVEDNDDAAWSLSEMLMLAGHHAEVARTGADALRLAAELRPELVLCDIGLPDMDGYDVARQFRGDERLRDVALVALSGYATPHDRARAAAAGFSAHLAKPLDPAELARVLREWDVRTGSST